jgi:hypothetical protein
MIILNKDMEPQFTPFQLKNNILEPVVRNKWWYIEKAAKKVAEYNFHLAIISSAPYK